MKDAQRLDPWVEGYLDYLRDVRKLKTASLRDFRCALRRAALFMEQQRPGTPMWKCSLQD